MSRQALFAALLLAFLSAWDASGMAYAKSAYSPRHSGLEPPGGPRPLEAIPGHSPSRTAEGGMGYKDAYGNTIRHAPDPAKPARERLRQGAYGARTRPEADKLPEVDNSAPLWRFE